MTKGTVAGAGTDPDEALQSLQSLKRTVQSLQASKSFVLSRNPDLLPPLKNQPTLAASNSLRTTQANSVNQQFRVKSNSISPELQRTRSEYAKPVISRSRSADAPVPENTFGRTSSEGSHGSNSGREFSGLRSQLSKQLNQESFKGRKHDSLRSSGISSADSFKGRKHDSLRSSGISSAGPRGLVESPDISPRSPSSETRTRLPPRSDTIVVVRDGSFRREVDSDGSGTCGIDCRRLCSKKAWKCLVNSRENCYEEPRDKCLDFLEWWGKTFCCHWDWPNDCGCEAVLGRKIQQALGCCWILVFTSIIFTIIYAFVMRQQETQRG